MNRHACCEAQFTAPLFNSIVDGIHREGYVVLPGGFDPQLATALFAHLQNLESQDFRRGGVGRDTDHHVNPFVRKDRICWLAPDAPAIAGYFAWAEALRLWLNRHLFLGLFDYECHFAAYPQGAFYRKHLDAFKGHTNRRLTTVLYLNPVWHPADGGELLLYQPGQNAPFHQVIPAFGTLVIFLSETFPHEVLPAAKPRYSLTGWYRVNTHCTLQ